MEEAPNNDNSQYKESDFDLRLFFSKYLRYWHIVLTSLIVALGAAYYYNWYSTPQYSIDSAVLISIDNSILGADDLLKEIDQFNKGNRNLENEIQILQSRTLSSKAIEQLEFDVSYYLKGDIKISEWYKKTPFKITYDTLNYMAYVNTFDITILDKDKFAFSYLVDVDENSSMRVYPFDTPITNDVGTFMVSKRAHFEDALFQDPNYEYRNYEITFNDPDAVVQSYLARLGIEIAKGGSSILKLSIVDPVREKGVDFINTLVDVYIKNDIQQKNEMASNSLRFINSQLDVIEEDLRAVEMNKEQFKSTKGFVDISSEASLFLEQVQIIDAQNSEISSKISFVDYLENYIGSNNSVQMVPASMGLEDPVLSQLIAQLIQLESERERIEFGKSKESYNLEQINAQISNQRQKLVENLKNIKNGLQFSLEENNRKLEKFEGQIRSMPQTEREYFSIEREYHIKESLYSYLLTKQKETDLIMASTVSDNRVIDRAVASRQPIRPVKSKNYAIALILGLLIPMVFVYFKEFLNDVISDGMTLGRITQIPVIGIIGFNKLEDTMVVLEKPKSLISESFRAIRTNLKYIGAEGKQKVTLITSSIGGEGKTFCAKNLSYVIALSGQKTVLVGLDLRKPKITEDTELSNDVGLSNYLSGSAKEEDIILPSGWHENLYIIPSGHVPPNPSELIMTERMDQLFDYLNANFDRIIIDTPPIGLVTDALILTKYADSSVYVVRQNVTRKPHLSYVNSLYREKRINNLCILFNAVRFRGGKYGYGYGGYGYGYGYGYGHGYGNGSSYGYYEESTAPKKSRWAKLLAKVGLSK